MSVNLSKKGNINCLWSWFTKKIVPVGWIDYDRSGKSSRILFSFRLNKRCIDFFCNLCYGGQNLPPPGLNRVNVFENIGPYIYGHNSTPVEMYQRSFPAPRTIFSAHRNICSVHLLHRQFMFPFFGLTTTKK